MKLNKAEIDYLMSDGCTIDSSNQSKDCSCSGCDVIRSFTNANLAKKYVGFAVMLDIYLRRYKEILNQTRSNSDGSSN